jgi:hypothetical protein
LASRKKKLDKKIQTMMEAEERIRQHIDSEGNRWRKVYVGGGEHFRNWLAQCRELGEVRIEEIDSGPFTCFSESGEKMYRIWMKIGTTTEDDLLG